MATIAAREQAEPQALSGASRFCIDCSANAIP